ncbi:diguanylate cyclase [Acidovorax sp.]|uniref:GGDEF domain-containing protein n=1 Tax=Acidovorax sp. TaxID=1872122 RepID=UPI002ACE7326|nr:diguanylate cyclase [Acidovorax sp.]MDZ7862258.1 diguanylate cyclase [Acidovorax sp.]
MTTLVSLQLLLYALLWLLCSAGLRLGRAAMLHWMGYALASAGSIALIAWRPDGPVWLTHSGSSLAVMLSLVLAGRGVEVFMDLRPSDKPLALMVLVAVLGLAWIGPHQTNARVALMSSLNTLLLLLFLARIRLAFLAEFGLPTTIAAAMPPLALVGLNIYFVSQALTGANFDIAGDSSAAAGAWITTLVAAAAFNYLFLFLVGFRLVGTLRRQARQDKLTGLHNRRAMEDRLQMEWVRAQRYTKPFTVICVDIDHFKLINDQYGHAMGDRALQMVAHALQATARDTDHVSRIGGEEFLVLMPEADARSEGVALAERLRQAVAALQLQASANTTIPLRASFGVAQSHPDDMDQERVLRRADQALYDAKHAGRNCVVLHQDAQRAPATGD